MAVGGRFVGIVGPGAVGAATGARLKMLGFLPVFLDRSGIVSRSIKFHGWDQSVNMEPESSQSLNKVEALFVAVKAFDLVDAIDAVLEKIPRNIPIITLSNGAIESELKELARKHGEWKWRKGVGFAGSFRVGPNEFSLGSPNGYLVFGSLEGRVGATEKSKIEALITESDSNSFFRWSEDAIVESRKKWVYNVVINTLCTVHSLGQNGLLLERYSEVKSVHEEAYRLAQDMWGPWPTSFSCQYSHQSLLDLINLTSGNENSMYRDSQENRKTENDYLAGIACKYQGYPLLQALSVQVNQLLPTSSS
eukprot:CAMPEP_0113956004 /NCGR_PEP_ID=MMETSP0011_2-20120614/1778_1 /TAXON_ID=101924 /ORGANISM="Rhodosorus marinus" /LENGTH=306 /DNA_ID=CAMNT_0000966017 /DNA_START=26 /DNA_END=946 /DNA_ORIENTATION=- /assembly_acc=CAM_ASM_000156